jgi:hypothetical protein
MAKFDASGFVQTQLAQFREGSIVEQKIVSALPTDLKGLKALAEELTYVNSVVGAVKSATISSIKEKAAPLIEGFKNQRSELEKAKAELDAKFAELNGKMSELGLTGGARVTRTSTGTGTRQRIDPETVAKVESVGREHPDWGNQRVAKEVFGEDYYSHRGTVYSILKRMREGTAAPAEA